MVTVLRIPRAVRRTRIACHWLLGKAEGGGGKRGGQEGRTVEEEEDVDDEEDTGTATGGSSMATGAPVMLPEGEAGGEPPAPRSFPPGTWT